jgi:hypothetical protein
VTASQTGTATYIEYDPVYFVPWAATKRTAADTAPTPAPCGDVVTKTVTVYDATSTDYWVTAANAVAVTHTKYARLLEFRRCALTLLQHSARGPYGNVLLHAVGHGDSH